MRAGLFGRLPPDHRFLWPRAFPRRRAVLRASFRAVPPSPSLYRSSSSSSPSPSAMDEKTKQHYLADSPPTVVKLQVQPHFDNLQDDKLRKYAHFISK
jgi:dipeptidyl-peptidase-3